MNQLEFSLNEQCRDSLWPGENRVTFRLCLSAFLQTELPRNAVLMNPPSEYPFGSAIEEQFNYVLGLLERDGYRYHQDSGAIKPRFEQRRFEVLRRVTGPNNSPIYQLVYDAIDYLETLHAEQAEQQTLQIPSSEAIVDRQAPAKIDRINFQLAGVPLASIEIPTDQESPTTPSTTKTNSDPLQLYVKFLKNQGITGTKELAEALDSEPNDSFVRHGYLLKQAEEFEIEKPTWAKLVAHDVARRRLARYFSGIKA